LGYEDPKSGFGEGGRKKDARIEYVGRIPAAGL
jgi:hypothetical protein